MGWNSINEALRRIGNENSGKWVFLENTFTGTLSTATNGFVKSTTWSTLKEVDVDTFVDVENKSSMDFVEVQDFTAMYPVLKSATDTAYPDVFTEHGGSLIFNKYASAAAHGKLFTFRGWTLPTQFVTATATATCEVPEELEDDLLVNLATFIHLNYEGDSEAGVYYKRVFGDDSVRPSMEGALALAKRGYSSQKLNKMRVTYIFGENSKRGRTWIPPTNPYA